MIDRLSAVLAGLLLAAVSVSAERIQVGDISDDVNVIVLESNDSRTVIRFDIGAFDREATVIEDTTYYRLRCGAEGVLHKTGEPALPKLSRSIIIPDDARMTVNVLSARCTTLAATPVVPSKGNLERTVNPEDIPFRFGDVYASSDWYPSRLAAIREPFILRDHRGTVVDLYAFQYHPGDQALRVYTSVTVEVIREGTDDINVLNRRPRPLVPDFGLLYGRRFINYYSSGKRYNPVLEAGDMLIIAHDDFCSAMTPFINWKRQKGIKTTMVEVSTIGNTATQIKSYIQAFYDSTDLTFVLLVGDGYEVATPYASSGAADPTYALVDGSDHYPDIFVGRFSAESVSQVETQVERTITYELTFPGLDWFHRGTGIASTQGPGHNGEYDYQHLNLIRDDLLAFTYTEVDRIYDPWATASAVSSALNEGRGIINYTGHGSTISWGTSNFSISHVNSLVNDNMLPFIISVACVNGSFVGRTCFAETWLRASHNGVPTGAIATYMSSINQSWNPPMDAQDEVADLLVSGQMTTFGGLCFNGACRMMEINGSDGQSMFDTWHIFGDPSVQVRTDNPEPLTVNHAGVAGITIPEYEVEVVGVDCALCALYHNGILYGSACTGPDGTAAIPVGMALPFGETVTLTVTAFNKATFVDVVVVTAGLSIVHEPLEDTRDTLNDYEVVGTIYSDTTLVADSLLLQYTVNSIRHSQVLQAVRSDGEYAGYIPPQSPGTVVSYYLFAKNDNDLVDSTEICSFTVIDYGVILEPEFSAQSALVDDTVWYQMAVTNDGVPVDDFTLAVANNAWDVLLWDETATSQIASTPPLSADETFSFLVSVAVGSSMKDEYDSAVVVATSNSDGTIQDTAVLKTISLGEPLNIPFIETFPTTLLDLGKWEITSGVQISDLGLSEPSGPYSLNLNGDPGGADTLVSKRIQLKDQPGVILKYSYQRAGGGDSPEEGNDLFVEYFDSSDAWVLVMQHAGIGDDMAAFESVQVSLPPEACHRGFLVRFHNVAAIGALDDWFVDDIYIGADRPDYCGDIDGSGSGPDIADLVYFVDWAFNSGPGPPLSEAADLDGSGGIPDITDLVMLIDYMFNQGAVPVCHP